jgi:hypothetical protein
MKNVKIKATVKIKAYNIISRAVEEGIDFGYRRAHKYTNTPSEDTIKDELEREIMNSLCEVLEFSD